jgi:hypothetical protein
MTPELRAFALAFGQPETPAPELSPNGYPQVLVSMEKLIAAIRDAERAAYERAAKEISCACLDKPECIHPHACCREDVAAILALIDTENAE